MEFVQQEIIKLAQNELKRLENEPEYWEMHEHHTTMNKIVMQVDKTLTPEQSEEMEEYFLKCTSEDIYQYVIELLTKS